MLTNVQIVNVPVSDQEAAHDFYVGRLGLSVVADLEGGPHGRWLQVGPEGAATTLALTPAAPDTPAGSAGPLVFSSSDIEADVERLTGEGVVFPDGIQDMPWARAARFADPDGNPLVLQTVPAA